MGKSDGKSIHIASMKQEKNTVWFLSSALPMPMNLIAVHCWLVTIDKKKVINRWEVWQTQNECRTSWGHVHKNLLNPWDGIAKYPTGNRKKKWPIKILKKITGAQAISIIRFVEQNAPKYSFCYDYSYWPGPNSNTFVQWIINNFPELTIQLPGKAIGKKFSFKNENKARPHSGFI